MSVAPTLLAVPMDDASRIGEARRRAASLAAAMTFDDDATGRLAVVVTEIATNLVRHATKGRLLLAPRPKDACPSIEALAIDEGPGMKDVAACLRDGYSTAGTPGTGLGAVQRLSDTFDIHSSPADGTLLVARISARTNGRSSGIAANGNEFLLGAASTPAPGETVCGDAWSSASEGQRLALIVADGLGHGPDAAEAANAALEVFNANPFGDIATTLASAHQKLRSTRGAAVSIVIADTQRARIRFGGAGNVMGRVLSGINDRMLMPQNGSVGVQMRSPQEQEIDWPPHSLVVLHTDGVTTRWNLSAHGTLLQRDPSLVAALVLRDHVRGRDDATIVVFRRNEA